MHDEIKAAFIARLRSGQDEQTHGCLNRTAPGTCRLGNNPDEIHPAGLCCLGVLSEQAVAAGIVVRVTDEVTHPGQIGYKLPGEPASAAQWGILHVAVVSWAGLNSADPIIRYGTDDQTMAGLNDELRLSFVAIADLAEAQL